MASGIGISFMRSKNSVRRLRNNTNGNLWGLSSPTILAHIKIFLTRIHPFSNDDRFNIKGCSAARKSSAVIVAIPGDHCSSALLKQIQDFLLGSSWWISYHCSLFFVYGEDITLITQYYPQYNLTCYVENFRGDSSNNTWCSFLKIPPPFFCSSSAQQEVNMKFANCWLPVSHPPRNVCYVFFYI